MNEDNLNNIIMIFCPLILIGVSIVGIIMMKWSVIISTGTGFFAALAAFMIILHTYGGNTNGFDSPTFKGHVESELSKKMVSELKKGDNKSSRSFSTDYLTIIYSPDPFDVEPSCEIRIHYYDGENVLSNSHPRTNIYYHLTGDMQAISVPNFISAKSTNPVRIKGDNSRKITEIGTSVFLGGQLGQMQVATKGTSAFDDTLDIMLSSSSIVVDSGQYLGTSQLFTFLMNDFSDAYSASQTLCGF